MESLVGKALRCKETAWGGNPFIIGRGITYVCKRNDVLYFVSKHSGSWAEMVERSRGFGRDTTVPIHPSRERLEYYVVRHVDTDELYTMLCEWFRPGIHFRRRWEFLAPLEVLATAGD